LVRPDQQESARLKREVLRRDGIPLTDSRLYELATAYRSGRAPSGEPEPAISRGMGGGRLAAWGIAHEILA
jgi:hypothetical protein